MTPFLHSNIKGFQIWQLFAKKSLLYILAGSLRYRKVFFISEEGISWLFILKFFRRDELKLWPEGSKLAQIQTKKKIRRVPKAAVSFQRRMNLQI